VRGQGTSSPRRPRSRRQDTARALQRRLRTYLRPSLVAIDEIGYLAYDAHAADLLFQVVIRRYESEIARGDHELTLQTMGHRRPAGIEELSAIFEDARVAW